MALHTNNTFHQIDWLNMVSLVGNRTDGLLQRFEVKVEVRAALGLIRLD